MPRADSGYPYNFEVNSWVFKDDESKTEAKTNSGHRVCLLSVCTVHAQCPLLACCVNTQTQTHTHTHITDLSIQSFQWYIVLHKLHLMYVRSLAFPTIRTEIQPHKTFF